MIVMIVERFGHDGKSAELKALRGQSKGTRKVFSRRMTSFAIDNLTQFNEALLALAQEEQHSVVSPTTLKAHQSLFQQVG